MAIRIRFNEVGVAGIVFGVIGTIYGAYRWKKDNDLAKKLDTSIEELEKKTTVDISEDVINKAARNVVERQVTKAVKKAIEEVSDQIRSDMDSMIRKDVDRVYGDLKAEVEERVSEEIAAIDYDQMRSDIRRKAEKKVFDEFCSMVNLGKMFGNSQGGRSIDFDGVSKLIDKVPWSERGDLLTSIFGKRD